MNHDQTAGDHRVGRYPREYIATVRNRPGGFYVAAADASAARHALTRVYPPAAPDLRVMMSSDGVARLVERFSWTWRDLVDVAFVEQVRERERAGAARGARQGQRRCDRGVPLPSVEPLHERPSG